MRFPRRLILPAAFATLLVSFSPAARAGKVTGLAPAPSSTSVSQQFIVFAEDRRLRLQAADFADEIKGVVCDLVGEKTSAWKTPILINFTHGSAAEPDVPPSEVRMLEIEGGFKVQIDVRLDADPAQVHFDEAVARAVLLEFMYRGRDWIRGGSAYAEPPPWVVDGVVGTFRGKHAGTDPAIFKALVGAGRLPPITKFLYADPARYDSTSLALYYAYSVALLSALGDQPDGHASLASYLRDLPGSTGDYVADLMAHFKGFGKSTETLDKFWTLALARLSTTDRYAGMSIEASEAALAPLLTFEIPTDTKGGTKTFTIDDYRKFMKLPKSRAVLAAAHEAIVGFSARTHPLYRPVVEDYEQITARLARGKTRGIEERLESATKYRELVSQRISDIADYLNWFEATQMGTRSRSFDAYLHAASHEDLGGFHRTDALSLYMDEVAKQYR